MMWTEEWSAGSVSAERGVEKGFDVGDWRGKKDVASRLACVGVATSDSFRCSGERGGAVSTISAKRYKISAIRSALRDRRVLSANHVQETSTIGSDSASAMLSRRNPSSTKFPAVSSIASGGEWSVSAEVDCTVIASDRSKE